MPRASHKLAALTEPKAVAAAIREFDRAGRANFLAKYGFGPARAYYLLHEGRRYDSKALAAAAYGYQYPDQGPLQSDKFSGGERTVVARLKALGFYIEKITGPATTITDPKPGDVLTNRQLMSAFRVSNSGGMRRSLETNTLILVSDFTKSLYLDEWQGEVLHYCGMGQKGDQSLSGHQNKTLANSRTNGVAVHYFEVYKKNRYTYVGRVELVGDPYESRQDDAEQKPRRVWMFPLRLVSGTAPPLPADTIRDIERRQRKQARRLTDEEVATRAARNSSRANARSSTTTVYIRDVYVAEHARRRADGRCELCRQPAPFMDKKGEPFLEIHHVVWLAKGGEDSVENTVALCPNCHRRMHILDSPADHTSLLNVARVEAVKS